METERPGGNLVDKRLDNNASMTERREMVHALPPKPMVDVHAMIKSEPPLNPLKSMITRRPIAPRQSGTSPTIVSPHENGLGGLATLPPKPVPYEEPRISTAPEHTEQPASPPSLASRIQPLGQEVGYVQEERGSSPDMDEAVVPSFLEEEDIEDPPLSAKSLHTSSSLWKPIGSGDDHLPAERTGPNTLITSNRDKSLLERIALPSDDSAQRFPSHSANDTEATRPSSPPTMGEPEHHPNGHHESVDSRVTPGALRASTGDASNGVIPRGLKESQVYGNGVPIIHAPTGPKSLMPGYGTNQSDKSSRHHPRTTTNPQSGRPHQNSFNNSSHPPSSRPTSQLPSNVPIAPRAMRGQALQPVSNRDPPKTPIVPPEPKRESSPKPPSEPPPPLPKPTREEIIRPVEPLNFGTRAKVIGQGKLKDVDLITRAEETGTPSTIEGCSICPKGCTILGTKEERMKTCGGEESIIPGKVGGCMHEWGPPLVCLSMALPKEDPARFEVISYDDKRPGCLQRSLPGSSTFLQATGGERYDALFRCMIVPDHDGRFFDFLAEKDHQSFWDEVKPSMEEFQEASESGIQIHNGVLIKGDILIIPPQSWYQIIPLQSNVTISTWHTYTITSISQSLNTDLYLHHRICHHYTLGVRKILYHYLQAVQRAIDNNGKDPNNALFKLNKQPAKTIKEALRLFDRILVEEYTAATRQHEARLKEVGPCDFCGGEIFHSAFVCSETMAASKHQTLPPGDFCEVRLCPSCCSEGRSCLCGNLRPCSTLDFDSLLALRNSICDWFIREYPKEGRPTVQVLTTCDIYEDTVHRHVMLGAIAIQQNRRFQQLDPSVAKKRMELRCGGGAVGADVHEISRRQSVTCNDCNETICFPHLLASGIHGSEAAFRSNHEWNWHEIHSSWCSKWFQWSKQPDYKMEDPDDKRLSLASSLSTCKPFRPANVRLGFYDLPHSSVTCAAYEDDPIVGSQDIDEDMASNADVSGFELMHPIMKHLKGKKRKSETPEVGTPAKKRKRKVADSAFNPNKKKKGPVPKTSKAKGKAAATAASTPTLGGYDTAADGARTSSPGTAEPSELGDMFDDSPTRTNGSAMKVDLDLVFSTYASDMDEGVPTSTSPTTPGLQTAMSERDIGKESLLEERIRQLETEKLQAEERASALQARLLALGSETREPASAVSTQSEGGNVHETSIMTSPIEVAVPLFLDTEVDLISPTEGEISALRERVDEIALENRDLNSQVKQLTTILEEKDLEIINLRKEAEQKSAEITNLRKEAWQIVNPSRSASTESERKARIANEKSVAGLLRSKSNQSRAPLVDASTKSDSEEVSDEDGDRDELDLLGGRY